MHPGWFLFLLLILTYGCLTESGTTVRSGSGQTRLFFLEEWMEIPAETPVTQGHVQNADLLLTRHGPGGDSIKKSHHDTIPGDPWYIWSGLCTARWALTLQKKNALVDLSVAGRIRLRVKQSGGHVLKVILGLDDDTWLVSEQGFGETSSWHEFSADLTAWQWRRLDIQTIEADERIKKPDLRRVRSIGWTDLMTGGGSNGCTRVDWIEVYGSEVQP